MDFIPSLLANVQCEINSSILSTSVITLMALIFLLSYSYICFLQDQELEQHNEAQSVLPTVRENRKRTKK